MIEYDLFEIMAYGFCFTGLLIVTLDTAYRLIRENSDGLYRVWKRIIEFSNKLRNGNVRKM